MRGPNTSGFASQWNIGFRLASWPILPVETYSSQGLGSTNAADISKQSRRLW